MARLTYKQRAVLEVLAAAELPLTPGEIAQEIRRKRRVFQIDPVELKNRLRRLESARGLVERRGFTHTAARTWAITDTGRRALETETEEVSDAD